MRGVSLSILAGPADAPFVAQMARHIVRANRYPFQERVLVIDTLPTRSSTSSRQMESLRTIAKQLLAENVIDSLVDLGEFTSKQRDWANRHFSTNVRWNRDYRGVPLFGWIAGIDACTCEYHVHFDCDVLLHQASDYSWIEDGIETLKSDPTLFCVAPLPGPPRTDRVLVQVDTYSEDSNGYYRFSTFSSRRFLIARATYDRILPLSKSYVSRKRYVAALLTRTSPMHTWEGLVNARIGECGMSRANLKDGRAWTLHAPNHGATFQSLLNRVIDRIECGYFPSEQAGRYDLDLDSWGVDHTEAKSAHS